MKLDHGIISPKEQEIAKGILELSIGIPSRGKAIKLNLLKLPCIGCSM